MAEREATVFEKNLGHRIKCLRLKRGMSQQDLRDALEDVGASVTRQLITYWENSRRELKPEYIVALAQALDISCDELLTGRTKDGGVSKATCDACRAQWKAAVSAVLIASEGVQHETQA